MSPLVITLLFFALVTAAGTVGGGILFLGFSRMLQRPVDWARAFGSAFMGSLLAAICFGIIIKFMDDTTEPLLNNGYMIATGLGVAVALLASIKSFEMELARAAVMCVPFAGLVGVLLYVSRTEGHEMRETHGFYRGYEGVHALNLLNPPDAMSTPEKAVSYYNLQFKKMREANEEEGIGKLLTTSTHWDADWFNDNFQYITMYSKKIDPIRLADVLQDPKQHKVLALQHIASPIYGSVVDVEQIGNESMVQMDSGQLVRLHKEGKNWKVRDWLGMRSLVMENIYPIKEKNGALTEEDRAAMTAGFKQYENETKQLAAKMGMPYMEFDPYVDEETIKERIATRAGLALAGAKSATGFRQLDAAKPGQLVDLQSEPDERKVQAPAALPVPPPAQPAAPLTTEQRIALLNNQMDAQVASMSGQATPANAVKIDNADPLALEKAAAAMAASQPASQAFLPNIPVDRLWTQYFSAIGKAEKGAYGAPAEYKRCLSNGDSEWFNENAVYIAALVNPGAQHSPEQAQLIALQALLPNLPRTTGKPVVKTNGPTGVAQFTSSSPAGARQQYVSLIVQEGGRWVLANPFFTRTFLWVPQIAQYKRLHNLPLNPEEQAILSGGFAPYQQQIQQLFKHVGFSG